MQACWQVSCVAPAACWGQQQLQADVDYAVLAHLLILRLTHCDNVI